jgi:hypothetical protein
MLCKSKLDICVSTNLLFFCSIMDFIINNITIYTSLECAQNGVYFYTKRISENKLLFSGPDLTLSPTVLVDIEVTRRIAEI